MGEETYDNERFVLVVRLPREVEVRIEDTFLALGGTTRSTLGYHVTLLGPFSMQCERQTLDDQVRHVAQQFTPFAAYLSGLESFQASNDNVVYLCIADSGHIVAAHDALLATLHDHITWSDPRHAVWMTTGYHPHVTLGLGLSDVELAEFLRISADRPFEATFQVTRICMARQVPHGPWEYVADFPLFGESSSLRPGNPPCAR